MFDELESFDCEEIWRFVKIIKWRKKLPLCQDVERCHNVCWRVHRSPKPFRWYFLTTSRLKVETMKLYELIRRSEGLRTYENFQTETAFKDRNAFTSLHIRKEALLDQLFIRPLTHQCGYVYRIHASYYDDNIQCYSWLPTTLRDYLSNVCM